MTDVGVEEPTGDDEDCFRDFWHKHLNESTGGKRDGRGGAAAGGGSSFKRRRNTIHNDVEGDDESDAF
jgi:hypothetical protein